MKFRSRFSIPLTAEILRGVLLPAGRFEIILSSAPNALGGNAVAVDGHERVIRVSAAVPASLRMYAMAHAMNELWREQQRVIYARMCASLNARAVGGPWPGVLIERSDDLDLIVDNMKRTVLE